MNKPLVIVIGGPTASGKTSLAIKLAKTLSTEIISADSRQFYRELNIGVARPTNEEMAAVKHHFIADRSVQAPLSAGKYATEAGTVLDNLLKQRGIAVVCGGSGLYINALIYGLDELKPVRAEILKKVNELEKQKGLAGMTDYLKTTFPESAGKIDLKNPARVRRALELMLEYNAELSAFQGGATKNHKYHVLGYYLNPERKELYRRIDERVDLMIQQGLENEVRNLLDFKSLPVMQTVGYSEFFDYFSGKTDLQQCVALIKQHSRNYAKRQWTWFRNKTNFKSLIPGHEEETIFADLSNHAS